MIAAHHNCILRASRLELDLYVTNQHSRLVQAEHNASLRIIPFEIGMQHRIDRTSSRNYMLWMQDSAVSRSYTLQLRRNLLTSSELDHLLVCSRSNAHGLPWEG